MPDPVDSLILDLLEWIGPKAKPYREVIEAWRTSCPRLPVWEEANERGFIEHHHSQDTEAMVSVSALGTRFLAEQRRIIYVPLFPSYSKDTFLEDIKRWVQNGGSAEVLHSESGWSLLHLAAEFQNITAIEYLIDAGCDPNQRDQNGQTPLHVAVDSDIDGAIQTQKPLEYRTTKRLIELGADMRIHDNQGKTPIDWIDCYGEMARRKFEEVVGGQSRV